MVNQAVNFESATVFILATNETSSLRQIVSELYELTYFSDIRKIIIVAKNSRCPAYCEGKKLVSEKNDCILDIYIQKSTCVEECLAELPLLAESSHFIITVADGEMETGKIDEFIIKAKECPEKIICAAKWHKDSTVYGYGKLHELCSRCLNTFIGLIFLKRVRDPFSIYQIYPVSIYKMLNFSNPKRFPYEYTVKALHNGVEYEEIPTVYKQRIEGKSNFGYKKLFQAAAIFCLTSLKIRFSAKEKYFSNNAK